MTKEATVDEEGEETRTCSRGDAKETRPIPKLEPEEEETITYTVTKGDGSTWTKGSTETCDFTYERSVNESETFSHFTGVKVDDEVIDESNYTAESGSVNISLQPSYLETLDAGEHTLTPTFDDGEADTAAFTILEEDSEESDDSEEEPSEEPDDEPSDNPDDDGKNPDGKPDGKDDGKSDGKKSDGHRWTRPFAPKKDGKTTVTPAKAAPAGKGAAATGDESMPLLWASLAGAGMVSFLIAMRRRKRA